MRTFNRVRLGELRAVLDQRRGDVVPCFAFAEAEVDVCTGEVVDVELYGLVLSSVVGEQRIAIGSGGRTHPVRDRRGKYQQ